MNKKEKDTFVIRVRSRENNTWQGSVEWIEEKKVMGFRSALELIYLLNSVAAKEQEGPTDI